MSSLSRQHTNCNGQIEVLHIPAFDSKALYKTRSRTQPMNGVQQNR